MAQAQNNGWTPVENQAPDGWTPVTSSGAEQDRTTTHDAFSGVGLGTSSAPKGTAIQRGVESFNEQFGIAPGTKVSDVPKGVGLAIKNPRLLVDSLKTMYLNASAAQQQLIDNAYQLQHMTGLANKARGFALGVQASIPLFGPAINEAGKKLESGDHSGAIGSFVGIGLQMLGPHASKAKVAEAPSGEAMTSSEVIGKDAGKVSGAPGKMGELSAPRAEGETFAVKTRRLAQQITGSGPESTTEPMVQNFHQKTAEAAEKQAEQNLETEKINQAKTEKGFRDAGEQKAAHAKKIAEQKSDLEAARAKAKATYEAEKSQIETSNASEKAKVEKRLQATRDRDIESAQLNQEVQALEKDVRKEADRKFNEVREAVKGQSTDSAPLIDAVQSARKQVLAEYPDGVKEFDVILRLQGNAEEMSALRNEFSEGLGFGSDYNALAPERQKFVDDRISVDQQRLGEEVTENKPIDWNLAQALKTHIETKLRSRSTPPQVKRALYGVRDTLVDTVMGKMVEDSKVPGVAEKWRGARDFWRQYREDFYTPQGPSGSGSPVSKALDADPRDPYSTRRPFLDQSVESTLGNRGVETLRKYAQFGGDKVAERVQKIIAQTREIEGLPKVPKLKEPPAGPKVIPDPKAIEPPKPVEVNYAEANQIKPPDAPTRGDVTVAKQKKLRETLVSWGKFHTYDWGIIANSVVGAVLLGKWEAILLDPAFIAVRKSGTLILKPERVRTWIAQPLPEEIRAIEKAPRDVQNEWRGQMKSFIADQKAAGQPIKLHPTVAAWLYGRKSPNDSDWRQAGEKTPGEMRKDINEIRNRHKPTSSNPAFPNG